MEERAFVGVVDEGAEDGGLLFLSSSPPTLLVVVGLLVGALGAIILLTLRGWCGRVRYDMDKIPGPRPTSSLLGSLADFSSPDTHRVMLDWANRYGGIVRFRLATQELLLISDPAVVATALSREGHMPRFRPVYQSIDPFCGPYSNFMTTAVEEEWRSVRKTVAVAFAPDNIRKTFPILAAKANLLASNLLVRPSSLSSPPPHATKGGNGVPARSDKGSGGSGAWSVDMEDAFNRLMLDYVGEAAFDVKFDALTDDKPEVLEVMKDGFAEVNRQFTDPTRKLVADWLPWTTTSKETRGMMKRSLKVYEDLSAHVCSKPEPEESNKAMWAQLKRLKHYKTGKPLRREEVMSHMAVLVAAGFETSSHTLGWLLLEIASHPQVQSRIHEELRAHGLLHVAGKKAGGAARDLTPSDLPSLKYLDAVIKESLRLHPTAAVGSIRMTVKDGTQLGPYKVPANTPVWLALYPLHRSRHNYTEPDRFWPERWQQSAADDDSRSEEEREMFPDATPVGNRRDPARSYLPFMEGPKSCVGQAMAMFAVRVVAAMLLAKFTFRLAPQAGTREDVLASQEMALTLQSKEGIWLTATPNDSVSFGGADGGGGGGDLGAPLPTAAA